VYEQDGESEYDSSAYAKRAAPESYNPITLYAITNFQAGGKPIPSSDRGIFRLRR